jgi:AraC-like DNA-binding protein
MLIVIAPTFQQELKRRFPAIYRDLNHYLYRQDIPLTDEQFLLIHNIFRVIQGISTSTAQHRKFMLGNMLEGLFLMLSEYRQQNGIAEHQPTMNEEMFNRFHQDIVEHYTESREVKFYAEKQNLSAKYFATAIKNLTGVNAHAWINNYVIIQAKKLLLHQRQLNILQIATQLGFSDQAVFSRFFRNATGMSPREFKATL